MVKDETEAVDEMAGNLTNEQFARIEKSWNEYLKKRARSLSRFYAIWTAVFAVMLALTLFYAVFSVLRAAGVM